MSGRTPDGTRLAMGMPESVSAAPSAHPREKSSVETLVATGIDGEGLLKSGVRMNDVLAAGAGPEQLVALGYRAFNLL